MKLVIIGLALALGALLLLILVIATTRPDTITVVRSRLIHAEASKIFALLNNFKHWPKWAPQDRGDPSMLRSFEGNAEGIGSISDWRGSSASGEGRMEILTSDKDSRVQVRVNFRKPFRATNVNNFTLERITEGTLVTWSMRGTNVLPMKLMSVFTSVDRMLGKHFEAGLANLEMAAGQPKYQAPR